MRLPLGLTNADAKRELQQGKGAVLLRKWGISSRSSGGGGGGGGGDAGSSRRGIADGNEAARLIDTLAAEQQRRAQKKSRNGGALNHVDGKGLGCSAKTALYGECAQEGWWEDAFAKAAAGVGTDSDDDSRSRGSSDESDSDESGSESDSDVEKKARQTVVEMGDRGGGGGVSREALIGWDRCEGKLKRLMEQDSAVSSQRWKASHSEPVIDAKKRRVCGEAQKDTEKRDARRERKKRIARVNLGIGIIDASFPDPNRTRPDDPQSWWYCAGFRRAGTHSLDDEDEDEDEDEDGDGARDVGNGFFERDQMKIFDMAQERKSSKARFGLGASQEDRKRKRESMEAIMAQAEKAATAMEKKVKKKKAKKEQTPATTTPEMKKKEKKKKKEKAMKEEKAKKKKKKKKKAKKKKEKKRSTGTDGD